ncbi:MAG: T9SS type A sorting domain-containing protein [Bacteroidia bacterium]|nr:T9SS type A sorting domain-containing protein [Bacteroidia bacterium]
MKVKFIFIFNFIVTSLLAQFPGPVGTLGTSAMHTDSSAFVAWGTQCKITRGYQDISNTSLGLTTVGDSSMVIGKADGSIVSLGDGGIAIITFSNPIVNGTGSDFAVFENAFNNSFLELAFVEVSSDGINYFRFPPTSNLPTSPQYTNDATIDATKIDNLAGKYRALYGTPFDLQELSGIPQLNINSITHVKIIDVVGSINTQYGTYDKNNSIINDPWPTPFNSSGFDLDAVGVINQSAVGVEEFEKSISFVIYPNPSNGMLNVGLEILNADSKVQITNTLGQTLLNEPLFIPHSTFNIQHFPAGIYFVSIETKKGTSVTKLIKE